MNSRPGPRQAAEAVLPPMLAGLAVLVTLMALIASALHDPKPHDIPVGLAGPGPAVDQLRERLGSAAPGAFAFAVYDSEEAARRALDARQLDGALFLGPNPRLVVAGAAGDAVVGVITGVFSGVFGAQGTRLAVEVVHPFADGDPHGLVLFFLVVAVSLSAIVSQVVVLVRAPGLLGRVAVLVVYPVLAGLAAWATTLAITGAYGDQFWEVTGLASLATLAVGAPLAAAARLLGPAGLGLGALVLGPVSLVSSGGPVGSHLLPDFYRALSPWMPATEAYSALRGSLFFVGAGTAEPVALLATWSLAGIALLILFDLVLSRRRGATDRPAAGS